MTSINELKTDITKFKNKDITELQKFHHRIESVLEKLEDETQVSDNNISDQCHKTFFIMFGFCDHNNV